MQNKEIIMEVLEQFPTGHFSLFGSDGVAVETDSSTEYRDSIELKPGDRVLGSWQHDAKTDRIVATYLAPLEPSRNESQWQEAAISELRQADLLVEDARELLMQRFDEAKNPTHRLELDPRLENRECLALLLRTFVDRTPSMEVSGYWEIADPTLAADDLLDALSEIGVRRDAASFAGALAAHRRRAAKLEAKGLSGETYDDAEWRLRVLFVDELVEQANRGVLAVRDQKVRFRRFESNSGDVKWLALTSHQHENWPAFSSWTPSRIDS